MKYQPLPAEQEEQLRRLVAGCLARTGMHLVQPDELENLEPGQLGLTVSISMPGMGRIPPLTLAADPDRLRQALRPGPDLLRSGGLEVDCRRQLARADGALLGLTPKEFQLLAYLMKNQGLVLTRSQLLGAVWELDFSGDMVRSMLLSFGAAVLIHLLMLVLTALLRRPLHLSPVEQASVIYSNCVNLLIPVVSAILGKEWLLFTSMYMMVQIALLWSHCRMLLSGERTISLRNIFGNLNVISMLIGLALFLLHIRLPGLLSGAMESVGSMLGPISMVIIGMVLAGVDLRAVVRLPGIWKVIALRLVGYPLAVLCLLKFSGIASLVPGGADILLISLLAACAPSGTMVTQLAQVYGGDSEYAGAVNVLSTLGCIVTMPLLVALYQL